MDIQHNSKATKGYFNAIDQTREAGRLDYRLSDENDMIIDHTFVDPVFRGKSVARKLVMAAVDHARKYDIKIIPLCSYVVYVFDKTEEIRDVLKQR